METRKEFLEFLAAGLTDRDASQLYARETARTVWEEKLEGESSPAVSESIASLARYRGLREELAKILKKRDPIPFALIVHPHMPFMRAIADAYEPETRLVARVLRRSAAMPEQGIIPREFWIELQHAIFVAGGEKGLFILIGDDGRMEINIVPADRVFISNHIATCIIFWDFVRRGISPEFSTELYGEEAIRG
jgi:hypothetical protein